MNIEVLFTPADFAALRRRNLDETACVVFDIFRATSSMITALGNGAEAVIPVGEISDALAIRQQQPGVLLAGERDGLRICAHQSGGTDFDLGNSPREFTREKVAGKTIVTTTTNGTRALRACAHARQVLIGSFLNLGATVELILKSSLPDLMLICSGTFEQTAYEDVLGAGAACAALGKAGLNEKFTDSASMARQIYQLAKNDLAKAAGESRNGRRLLSLPELRDDVPFCLQRDVYHFAARMNEDGKITILK